MLSQVNDDKSECVVAYASRSLTRQEQRYCVTRRELLAIVEFTPTVPSGSRIYTQNGPRGSLVCWLERLAEYNFTVVHRRGTKHNNADALSRLPCKQCGRSNHLQGDMVGDEPVSRKIGDPIKLGTPVPYFPENRGPHPQFFGNLGIPHPYISRNLGIPL